MNQDRKEIVRNWIEALRSGKYTQGLGFLKQEEEGEIKHCCLGVLCEVQGLENKKNDKNIYIFQGEHDAFLPPSLQNILGTNEEVRLTNGDLEFGYPGLVDANDEGATFEEIADALEEHPEWFFDDWYKEGSTPS